MDEIYTKLRKNIKGLRKMFGETQLELALSIGVSNASVSYYETGKHIPEPTIIKRIANHYLLSEYQLINDNLSSLKKLKNTIVNNALENKKNIDKVFPIVCSEKASLNSCFLEAYEIHKNIYNCIICGSDFNIEDYDKCKDLYRKAAKEGVVEGNANHLWLIMFLGASLRFMTPCLYENIDKLQRKEVHMMEFIKSGFLPSFGEFEQESNAEMDDIKTEYKKESIVDVFVDICSLKSSKKYCELGDYYLALTYIFGMIGNEFTDEINSMFGFELMDTLKIMQNPYAKNFF